MARNAFLHFRDVTFAYDSATEPLFDGLELAFETGFTGIVGRNGSGKSTLLHLAAGELKPARGSVESRGEVEVCAQQTDEPPDGATGFLNSEEPEAFRIRGRLGLETDFLKRFATLSHGERKRLQIGTALFRQPAVLLLDEPTNHLDRDGRRLVLSALRSFRGVGLLVSHDRELLDTLCRACLFLGEGEPRLRPGGYSQGRSNEQVDRLAAGRAHDQARSEAKRLERETSRRREAASRAAGRLSKRGLDPKDHDAREKIDRAKVSGKDTAAGRRLRALDGRMEQARDELAKSGRPRGEKLGFTWTGSRSARNRLVRIEAGSLPLGEGRELSHPELELGGSDRVALSGPNGAGKSSLIRHLLDRIDLPSDQVVLLPQEVEAQRAREIVAEARRLSRQELGEVLSTVQRLGSDPERLLETDLPSSGELRKLLFALGSRRQPGLIVLDEPTNHLDLASVECLEEALSDYPGALLLVSHDRRFLEALTTTEWRIDEQGELTIRPVSGQAE